MWLSHTGKDLLLLPWRTADEDVEDVDSAAHHLQVRNVLTCVGADPDEIQSQTASVF